MARFMGVERKDGYLCVGGYGSLAGCVRDVPLWGSRVVRGLRRGRGWAPGTPSVRGGTVVRCGRVGPGAVWRRGDRRAFPARCRGRGVLEGIFRRGQSVDPDSEVRVGLPPKVVEVVGLVRQSGSDRRAD